MTHEGSWSPLLVWWLGGLRRDWERHGHRNTKSKVHVWGGQVGRGEVADVTFTIRAPVWDDTQKFRRTGP